MKHRTVALFLLLICCSAAACRSFSAPEASLRDYIDAVNDGRCEDALKHLSARTNYAIDSLRVRPQRKHEPIAVEQYFCNPLMFEYCKPDKMEVTEQLPESAKVSMPCGRTQDSFLPGFSSPFLKYEPRVTDLVYEDGNWRVALPFVIRIVDVREKEDELVEAERRRQAELRSKKTTSSTIGTDHPQPPPPPPNQ